MLRDAEATAITETTQKNDKDGGAWVRLGLTLKLEEDISTCYRLCRGLLFKKLNPVSNQTSRVQQVACVRVRGSAGSNQKRDENGGFLGPFGIQIKSAEGYEYLFSIGYGVSCSKS